MSTLLATGGILMGGQGSFRQGKGHRCQLEVTAEGLKDFLNKLTGYMTGWFKVGLYQNDHEPALDDDVGMYSPCTFSGYDGPQLVYGWTLAAMYGVRAKSFATELVWQHDGGPIGNDVWGYYVTDPSGTLKFAERFCDGPFAVERLGRKIKIAPTFATKNEREED